MKPVSYIARPTQRMPLRPIPASELSNEGPGNEGPGDATLYRLGHSSVLIRLDGHYLLTDPVFSKRASPVQWAGPSRFHPVPFELDDLPPLSAVVISHDHYDHLDKQSILDLASKTDYFLMPLGVGDHLRRWGIDDEQIMELDWWDEVELDSLVLAATPAQHFSGRGLTDRNRSLWASWVILGTQGRLFFSGDTGYFDGFKEIGEHYGPFDITMIETGAYNPLWTHVHMLPEQGAQAHIDLGGRAMLPIHNSTFNLSNHDWFDPLEQATALAEQRNIQLVTPVIGEAVSITAPQPTAAWWRPLMPDRAGSARADLTAGPEFP
ncbi:MAG: MBL fold metallo-hydrolase [Pseudomonadota bacterium]